MTFSISFKKIDAIKALLLEGGRQVDPFSQKYLNTAK
jgi:hypothetical protein